MQKPKVTVIFPVFNGEKFLHLSIRSILNQTFRDFELLLIDDGSTDKTREIISGFEDARIRFLSNEKNEGLIFTLNLGIAEAHGEFLARMDADDIAFPERLQKQVDFLEANPGTGIC